jgi:hypothetical protein
MAQLRNKTYVLNSDLFSAKSGSKNFTKMRYKNAENHLKGLHTATKTMARALMSYFNANTNYTLHDLLVSYVYAVGRIVGSTTASMVVNRTRNQQDPLFVPSTLLNLSTFSTMHTFVRNLLKDKSKEGLCKAVRLLVRTSKYERTRRQEKGVSHPGRWDTNYRFVELLAADQFSDEAICKFTVQPIAEACKKIIDCARYAIEHGQTSEARTWEGSQIYRLERFLAERGEFIESDDWSLELTRKWLMELSGCLKQMHVPEVEYSPNKTMACQVDKDMWGAVPISEFTPDENCYACNDQELREKLRVAVSAEDEKVTRKRKRPSSSGSRVDTLVKKFKKNGYSLELYEQLKTKVLEKLHEQKRDAVEKLEGLKEKLNKIECNETDIDAYIQNTYILS